MIKTLIIIVTCLMIGITAAELLNTESDESVADKCICNNTFEGIF